MQICMSRRFSLCCSRALYPFAPTPEKGMEWYGLVRESTAGHGLNPIVELVLDGPVNETTGMIANLSEIKHIAGELLDSRFDHRFLNVDTPPFDQIPPTAERLAAHLLSKLAKAFAGSPFQVAEVIWHDDQSHAAVAQKNGAAARIVRFPFCAGRRTASPHLSDKENDALFGIAARKSGHGHTYLVTLTLSGTIDSASGLIVPHAAVQQAVDSIMQQFDHRFLNSDVPALENKPVTTEQLALVILAQLQQTLPVSGVEIEEYPYFSVLARAGNNLSIAVPGTFRAAHRLHSPFLDDNANRTLYGKCNHPAGHGHAYHFRARFTAPFDQRSGTVLPLADSLNAVNETADYFDGRYLDADLPEFSSRPSTGEHIVQTLFERLEHRSPGQLTQVDLWETPNNRFSLARTEVTLV